MTEDQRRVFADGYVIGVEHAIEAHADIVALAAYLIAESKWNAESRRELLEGLALDDRVFDSLAKVRRLRESGAEQVLVLAEIEQALAVIA